MEFWKQLLDLALDGALIFAAAIVPILIAQGIRYAESKLKVDFSEKQEAKVHDLIDRAIHYADESARKHLKADADTKPDKMSKALAFITAEGKRMGLGSVLEEQADHLADMIESKIGQKRLDSGDKLDKTPKA